MKLVLHPIVPVSFIFSLSVILAACSETSDPGSDSNHGGSSGETECSGHGHLHDDHCDCDDGYVASKDELTCVRASACEALHGNVEADAFGAASSVAFLLVDGRYHYVRRPGAADTSISFVDSECKRAYGWSRDKSIDDETSRESSWVLDLETFEFTDIVIPGASWVVLRGAREDGTVVGKLAIDSGTPDDRSDDESRGFLHEIASSNTRLFERDGFDDIGLTNLDADGVLVGFNDFGSRGFLLRDDSFVDLEHPDAFRLFPFAISSGRVVGFWGAREESWYDNTVNPSFIAELHDDHYDVEKFELDGFSGVGLTGLNEAGQMAGVAYASAGSRPQVFQLDSRTAEPRFFAVEGNVEPFVTGISATGLLHGQLFVLEEEPVCSGHGQLEDDACVCDDGFELDPLDATQCLAPDAECSGHGHLHGDHCHCDEGYVSDPEDDAACIPE